MKTNSISILALAIFSVFTAMSRCERAHAQTQILAIAPPTLAYETSSTRSETPRLLPNDVPLTFSARDLNAKWQFVSVDENANKALMPARKTAASIPEAIDRALQVAPQRFLTQWQTVVSGAQSFLVAYRVEPLITSDNSRSFISENSEQANGNWQTKREYLSFLQTQTGARPLKLVLINLQNIALFHDIETYSDEERDAALSLYIITSGFRELTNKLDFQSSTNLHQLAFALSEYAQEHDEKIPPLQNIGVFKKAILPYVRDNAIFVQPLTKKFYATNATLTNKGFANIQFASQIVALYEPQVGTDSKRGVAFADGHVKRVTEIEWTKIKKQSGIK